MKILPAEVIEDFHVPVHLKKQGLLCFPSCTGKSFCRALFHDQPNIAWRIWGFRQLFRNLCGQKKGNIGEDLVISLYREGIL